MTNTAYTAEAATARGIAATADPEALNYIAKCYVVKGDLDFPGMHLCLDANQAADFILYWSGRGVAVEVVATIENGAVVD